MHTLSRRAWLRFAAAGVTTCGWLGRLAADAADHPQRRRSCVLLWMNGGPSTIDLFDLKPGADNGGPFKEIATGVPGIKIGEHLPKLAAHMKHLAIVRSMSTKEGDHGRATYLLRTGNLPQGGVQYPGFGSLVGKELARPDADLPDVISIAPFRQFSPAAYGPGFLGPKFAPLVVGESANFGGPPGDPDAVLKVQDLERPRGVGADQAEARLGLLDGLERDFGRDRPDAPPAGHRAAYDKAVRLMKAEAAKAFDLSEEPAKLRDEYGRNLFGQGCLLARRLVERGVPFVEVNFTGVGQLSAAPWDTHQNNFETVKTLCGALDPAWSSLLSDLKERGLLDTTTIVWMGELGRTPKIDPQRRGRDHF